MAQSTSAATKDIKPLEETWLDRVPARPAFGMLLDRGFEFDQETRLRFSPLVDEWIRNGRTSQVSVLEGGAVVVRSGSLQVRVTPDTVVFESVDVGKIETAPGERAELRYETSEVATYSQLANDLLSQVGAVLPFCVSKRKRFIRRIGVVATCNLRSDSLPPGMELFIKHLGKPWGADLPLTQVTILAPLGETNAHKERCHHHIDINEVDRPGFALLRLDWQREYASPSPLSVPTAAGVLRAAADDALSYFEQFASGSLTFGDGLR